MSAPEKSTTEIGVPAADDRRRHTDESLQSLMGFRLWPRLGESVRAGRIRDIVDGVHRERLDGRTWEDLDPKTASTAIAAAVKDAVKDFCRSVREDSRYKCTVQTFLSKFNSQSMTVQTRCLWDERTDRRVSENYVNKHVICSTEVVLIFFY